MQYITKDELNQLIDIWFREDIGDGDHTSLSCIPADTMGCSQLIIKEDGILAGVEVAQIICEHFDPTLRFEQFLTDGTPVHKGDIAFRVHGKVLSLLQVERTMLNIMQRMSGIATTTARYVKMVEGTSCRILDTRKTTPGLRMLEKESVKIGGGTNHRIGLFDMILLKDNHVDFAGGTAKAIHRAEEYCAAKGKDLKIEIEVRNFDEIDEALSTATSRDVIHGVSKEHAGPDRIMLDNFTPERTKEAVAHIRAWEQANGRKMEIESSGGITDATLRNYAECGVDFISVGALTHSVKGLDMSFKAVEV